MSSEAPWNQFFIPDRAYCFARVERLDGFFYCKYFNSLWYFFKVWGQKKDMIIVIQ